MSETPWHLSRPAPGRGEHTPEVLAEVAGYGPDQIAALVERGVIGGTGVTNEAAS
jgi:crotonobetainyl-CoA:carnitine CoA-transferase CaiB-like acyl-CoA transferase